MIKIIRILFKPRLSFLELVLFGLVVRLAERGALTGLGILIFLIVGGMILDVISRVFKLGDYS